MLWLRAAAVGGAVGEATIDENRLLNVSQGFFCGSLGWPLL